MPTRTFIGLIFLILALIVVSTPSLLNPASREVKNGLVAAGVPGIDNSSTASRPKGTISNKLKNSLELKGYLQGKTDMQDQLPVGERMRQNPGGRLSGDGRLLLPGETQNGDPNSPTILTRDGVLLDGTKCPVFRANVDIATIWKDPAQKAKYLGKAAKAANPAACTALLTNRVKAATNQTIVDPQNLREVVDYANSDDLSTSIQSSYWGLLDAIFPDKKLGSDAVLSRKDSWNTLQQLASEQK